MRAEAAGTTAAADTIEGDNESNLCALSLKNRIKDCRDLVYLYFSEGVGVVTRDIPANVIAFGNPCRVHRKLSDEDVIRQ